MISPSPESLAAAATSFLRLEPPPTEQEIDSVLSRLADAMNAGTAIVDETRRLLHSRFAIRMDLGHTLVADEGHAPWLDSRRSSIDPYYWQRYRELLVRKGWSPLVIGSLDRETEKLLDLLGDPVGGVSWSRRGLVMGDVQAGKTAAYTGLICKAADAGYRMIVLLTGTLENVRRQTQGRLDEGFVGFDSREFLDDARARHKRHLGVGLIDSRRDGVVFTSHENDFRKKIASALNIALAAVNEPVLVVTKKNNAVLGRLLSWLRSRNADRTGHIDVPMLLVDDEADNASVNTGNSPGEATAINTSIRDLLGLFRQASYVGFTATPFANIFIDPASTNEMLGDDLFPRDFIHVLEPPTNYLGVNVVFGTYTDSADPEAVESDPAGTLLRRVADADEWLHPGHKKDAKPGTFPESLEGSLEAFLLATAIRDLRRTRPMAVRDLNPHRSMLVNVSRFTEVQNRVADQLQFELDRIRRAVRFHGALPAAEAAISPVIASLESRFSSEFSGSGLTWTEVLGALHESAAPIRVQPVNQRTGTGVIDYGKADTATGLRIIAVGGNSLSRGLTLEGLSTSYFTRHARAYDTLLQMGRWFGFRDGYIDLCRLFLPDEIEAWYRHVAAATNELKYDFSRMERRRATPREFGLRVRSHPGTLLITARNKMATGMDVDVRWGVSLFGRMIESTRLFSDRTRNRENLGHLETFIGTMVARVGEPSPSPHGGALVWQEVEGFLIADLLNRFLVHPLNFDFQGEAIAEFITRKCEMGDARLASWRVALGSSGKADRPPFRLGSLPDHELRAGRRRVSEDRSNQSLLVSGSRARLGGRSDLRHAFSVERYKEFNSAAESEEGMRAQLDRPLLSLFLLVGMEASDAAKKLRPFREGLILPAISMHFPGTREPDDAQNLVRYRLNLVAQKAFLGNEVDDVEPLDDEDLDD